MEAIRPNQVVGFVQSNIDNTVKFVNDNLTTPSLVQLSMERAKERNFDGYAIMTPPYLKLDLEANMVADVFRKAGWISVRVVNLNEERGGQLARYVLLLSDNPTPDIVGAVTEAVAPTTDGTVTAMPDRAAR